MPVSLPPFQLIPTLRQYVWGGRALRRLARGVEGFDPQRPLAEVWAVYSENRVAGGAEPLAGLTLGEVCARYGAELLGAECQPSAPSGCFPLLVKLLDSAGWLSVQVHPNDAQAAELEGPALRGKSEVWNILRASPQAELIAGLRPQALGDHAGLAAAIRAGRPVLDLLQRHPLSPGQTYCLPAGTLHALGPGALVYELQQASDVTYRVYDWDRPLSAGRALHLEQAVAVADPLSEVTPRPFGVGELAASDHFRLSALRGAGEEQRLDGGFKCLTLTRGTALVKGAGWRFRLRQFDTLVIPACVGERVLQGQFDALLAGLP